MENNAEMKEADGGMELKDMMEGAGRMPRLVAVEPDGASGAELFVRESGEAVEIRRVEFRPFVLCEPRVAAGIDPALVAEERRLDDGGGAGARYSRQIFLTGAKAYEQVLKSLKKGTGFSPGGRGAPYRVFGDARQQLLVAENLRLFGDMAFPELLRMQVDIETLTSAGFEFSNPERPGDEIVVIAMCDSSGWERCLSARGRSEKELLAEFVEVLRGRDPDVVEGHNIFRFDLPFIEVRAKRHGVPLRLGRGGEPIKKRNSRFHAAERVINYTRYEIHGRHLVDTLHLTQLYDVAHRDLDEYGLKAVARHFGVAAADRVLVEGGEIDAVWRGDPARIEAYALDDVRETNAISRIMSPSYFHQTQVLPISYQDCVVRGNATRIDALLVAAYLGQGAALPEPEQARAFSGGLTEAFESGVFKNVWHCDVRSLYPSIILADGLCPRRDGLGVFPAYLERLRTFRLEAKSRMRQAATPAERDHFEALQSSFKTLINSFYGYLGFSGGTFNDFEMAERVTARGRQILTSMLETIRGMGGMVIEMDTDGLYFQPPPDVDEPAEMERRVQASLPPGVEVELDETYPAMFCYKSKNYALLSRDGEVAITGAALKSRGLEPFQRRFIHEFVGMLLEGEHGRLRDLAGEYEERIRSRRMPLAMLAKSETLGESPEAYKRKLAAGGGRRSAAYELALASGRDYRSGDQVSFYVVGGRAKVPVVGNSRLLVDAPPERDENVPYYLAKLADLAAKFAEFFPDNSGGDNPLGLDFG